MAEKIIVKTLKCLDSSGSGGTALDASLALAMCYINSVNLKKPNMQSRILVLQGSPDETSQYVSTMNCVFSAQKLDVNIDVCMVGSTDSSSLQQAASLTSGIYLKPMDHPTLTQYLLSAFLMDKFSRSKMWLPTGPSVNFRATCFCKHDDGKPRHLDIGNVCTVCLAVLCDWKAVCSQCGTKVAIRK